MNQEGEAAIKDSKFKITGQGVVSRSFNVSGQSVVLKFNDAIHTPELSSNLILVGKLCNTGYKVTFDKEKAHVYHEQGNGFTCIQGTDKLYGFDSNKLETGVKAFASNSKPTDLETWHR